MDVAKQIHAESSKAAPMDTLSFELLPYSGSFRLHNSYSFVTCRLNVRNVRVSVPIGGRGLRR